jgi:hypothetical protein
VDKPDDARLHTRAVQLGEFLSTVTIAEGDPGFRLPALGDAEAIRAFYDVFCVLPRSLLDSWLRAKHAPTTGGHLASPEQQADETAALDEWLERKARAEFNLDEPDEMEPLPAVAALNHPAWYIERAWSAEREHGILPHGGALNTLPLSVLEDLNTLDERYAHFYGLARQEWEEKQERRGSGGRSPDGDNWTDPDWQPVAHGFDALNRVT